MLAFEGNEIIGVAPFYVKFHSQGEYIFDHNWAHSFEVAGGRYYPKGQIAVPFTPATGRRLLAKVTAEKRAQNALLAGAVAYARKAQLSSVHVIIQHPKCATFRVFRVLMLTSWESRSIGF